MNQESIYKEYESDNFFERVKNNFNGGLREHKKEIKIILERNIDLKEMEILEIGCLIGDLLYSLKEEYKCNVVGIEPSSKACIYALKKYNLILENELFLKSKYMKDEENNKFDLIIIDDVLSWMDRMTILNTIAHIDKLLKEGGYLFIRDFCPAFYFACRNHHINEDKVYNYKQKGGHKTFFLMTGCYTIEEELIRKDTKYQIKQSQRNDSAIWSDALLKKQKEANHPIIEM